MRSPNGNQGKNNVTQEMSTLRNSGQTNQTARYQASEEPKLAPPSNAEHAQGHERKSNRGMPADKRAV